MPLDSEGTPIEFQHEIDKVYAEGLLIGEGETILTSAAKHPQRFHMPSRKTKSF